jgi:hypothetical protein
VKYFLKLTNSFKYIFFSYIASLLLASLLFSYVENHSFINSLYWACVTSLTIGYGDLSPITIPGKILAIVFGHFWIFLIIPSIISLVVTNLIQDKNEFKPSKGYQDGLKQGYKNASKEIANLFDKHLDYLRKSNKPNKNQDKAIEKLEQFLEAYKNNI